MTFESSRKTFIEMKNGTKKVETDDWRAVEGPEKRLDKQWRGRTVFKIKSEWNSLRNCLMSIVKQAPPNF